MEKRSRSYFKQSAILKIICIKTLILAILLANGKKLAAATQKENDGPGENPAISYVVDKKSELWKYIDSIPVIDTHEHISSEVEMLGEKVDIFNLFTPYIVDNLQSAGMTNEEISLIGNWQADFKEKWDVFYKYYPLIKNSTYFQALVSALEFQYQMKSVSIEEFQRISNRLTEDYATKGFMQKIMNLNKIESIFTFRSCALEAVRKTYGEKIFVVPTVSSICVRDSSSLSKISRTTETQITNLDYLLKGIDKLFSEYAALGIKNLKFDGAYYRRLNYRYRTREEAEASFSEIMQPHPANSNRLTNTFLQDYQIPLDDYLTIHMISLANKYHMNAIFHVGLFAWNFNTVNNSHSSDLEWLIRTFPNVNFVILHAGYPFFDEAILLAKYYPNVYLNMTWDHIIERDKSINIMKSYIEMLPLNKIHLFGGDYMYPQQIYGNVIFTKENLYLALNEMIKKGRVTQEDAKSIAYKWLYTNPKSFY